MQLKILEALEAKIGLGIPIQEFFDLVIGTRWDLASSRGWVNTDC